jgi:hypothetical protein
MTIIVCRASEVARYRAIMRCPICATRRRFVVALYGWYSPRFTCCGCGSDFEEGLVRQPWKGSRSVTRELRRRAAIRQAKESWDSVTMSRREAMDALVEDMRL